MKQIIFSIGFLCLFTSGFAGDSLSIFDHLAQRSIVKLTIETNLKQLIRKKFREEYQVAKISYANSEDSLSQHPIKIKTRGNSRKGLCYFPPLKLKFSKQLLRELGMNSDFNKIKLVCPCGRSKTHQQYIVKEYLAYRMYNVLTDMSFKAQLLDLTLLGDKDDLKPMQGYAFLIESSDQLANRFQGVPYKPALLNPKYTLEAQTAMLSLFEYMIGNTDWSISKHHNIYSFRSPLYELPICSPYDFDYSGIVNASYAVPHESLNIESVTQRLFKGICHSKGIYEQAAQHFILKKEELYAVVTDCIYLNATEQVFILDYMSNFFRIIEHDKKLDRVIQAQCRG